jgi:cell division transport system permease protein
MTRTSQGHSRQKRPQTSALEKLFWQHRVVARDSLQRLLRSPLATAVTVAVIAIALLLPALLLLFQQNLGSGIAELDRSARISVYLEAGLSDAEAQEVGNHLQTWDGLLSVELISSSQALAAFSENAGLGEVLTSLAENPLPATLLLVPDSADLQQLEALQAELEALPEVAVVELDRAWIARLQAIRNVVSVLGQALLIFVLLGLFAIIGNTIRLAIENRRQEIRVQKLVGATDGYIARPFLYTGFLLGSAGGVTACLLLLMLWLLLGASSRELAALYNSGFELSSLSPLSALGLVLLGGGTGWVSALISSYRNIAAIDP